MIRSGHLTAKQRTAAALLASGESGRSTARSVDVTPQTVSHWARLPEFSEYFEGLVSRVEQSSAHVLANLRSKALRRLDSLIDSPNEAVALKAIETVLSASRSVIRADDEGRAWEGVVARAQWINKDEK